MFLGKEIRPPSRNPTPPPLTERLGEAGRGPIPARGGNAPARGAGPPTLPPAPMRTGGKGTGGRQMSALGEALSRPMELPVRSPDGSRQRVRSEQGHVSGPVATKSRTNAPPSVSHTPSRDSSIRRGLVGPPHETLESITRRSRCNSVHCGAGHRLPPIGSFKCGFCKIQFLPARNPIRRAPDIVDRGLDRDMQR